MTHVAVAANFADVARVLADRFTAETGREVRLTVGSTGQLYAQLREGAPFDLFLAADEERPRLLEEEDLVVAGSRATYAEGRLVLYAPGLDTVRGPADLRGGSWQRLAVANPRTAPYGRAAMQTLERLGLGSVVEERMARGESVGQALQFVRSGGAELGFVALSQVVGEPPASYWLVPDSLHDPIRQGMVLMARGADNRTARAFAGFLSRPSVREILRSRGYGPAGGP
ncbi:MAG: molybdate ABC transporter substrate-binding protein [Gemmatimonadetes bacterium]|nr:molybdate ABC transporter substrate-binding protein [Gemmatimonadota bacterium]